MTVTVYKQGDDMEILSEVREPNAAQRHNGNRMEVSREGYGNGPFSLSIVNDEVSIWITHKSTHKLLIKMLSHHGLLFEIMQILYHNESCKEIWRGWEENNGN